MLSRVLSADLRGLDAAGVVDGEGVGEAVSGADLGVGGNVEGGDGHGRRAGDGEGVEVQAELRENKVDIIILSDEISSAGC